MELPFYAYDSFDVMLNTFRHVALIMKDECYAVLLGSFFLLSLVIGSLKNSLLSLGQFNLGNIKVQWAGLTILAAILYVSFIRPTATLHIYDEKEGQYQTVPEVPQFIAITMSLLSTIETHVIADSIHHGLNTADQFDQQTFLF